MRVRHRLDDHEHKARVDLAQRSLEAARALAEQARLEAEQAQRQWKRTQDLARQQVCDAVKAKGFGKREAEEFLEKLRNITPPPIRPR